MFCIIGKLSVGKSNDKKVKKVIGEFLFRDILVKMEKKKELLLIFKVPP